MRLIQDHEITDPAVLAEIQAARRDGLGVVCTEFPPVLPGDVTHYEVKAISGGKRVWGKKGPDFLDVAATVRQWARARQDWRGVK